MPELPSQVAVRVCGLLELAELPKHKATRINCIESCYLLVVEAAAGRVAHTRCHESTFAGWQNCKVQAPSDIHADGSMALVSQKRVNVGSCSVHVALDLDR